MSLARIDPGNCAVIQSLGGPPEIRQRLREMGLTTGMQVQVIRRAPLGDPIEVLVRGYHLTLRSTEAACVAVRSVSPDSP